MVLSVISASFPHFLCVVEISRVPRKQCADQWLELAEEYTSLLGGHDEILIPSHQCHSSLVMGRRPIQFSSNCGTDYP